MPYLITVEMETKLGKGKKYESLFLFPLKVWPSSCLHRSFYLHRPIEAGREWDQGPKLDSDCTVLTFPGH